MSHLLTKHSRVVIFTTLFTLSLVFTAPVNKPLQYTCLWVVRNSILSEQAIDEVVDFAARNKITHLFVQVRGRGDALYQSDIVPRSALLANDSFDPLSVIIRRAHSRGIQVHAWVNVYILWSSNSMPYSNDHLVYTHPDWFDQDDQAKNAKAMIQQYREKKGRDEGIYLAPHHPSVNPYLLAVFRELVAKYDLDGLHFDYIRYKDSHYGKNDKAMEHYTDHNGDDPQRFLFMKNLKTNDVQTASKLSKWGDYKRQAVTNLVRDTHRMIAEVRPDCILSAAVKPNLYEARDRYLQEWDVWLAANYIDWAIPMNYSVSIRGFAKNIDIIYDNLPQKYRDKIIMGIATYNQKAPDVADKIKYTKITRFPGVALFSYSVVGKNPRYMDQLRSVLLR